MAGILIVLIGLTIITVPMLKDRVAKIEYDTLEVQVAKVIEASRVSQSLNQQAVSMPWAYDDGGNLVTENLSKEDEFLIEAYRTLPTEIVNDEASLKEVKEKKVYTEAQRNQYLIDKFTIDGFLKIEAIDLKVLIIEDTSQEHLDFSPSSMLESRKPWDVGNYAIAGHRALKYGHHFNRLNEIEIGDKIIVEAITGEIYEYEVYQQVIVHESDYSVLSSKDINEITLITCDPIGEKNPEYRLIVKGKQIN